MSIKRLIVVEGVDGSGKSTQAHALVQWLNMNGYPAEYVRFPGGSPVAEKIRELMLKSEDPIMPEAELALTTASFIQTYGTTIKRIHDEGKIVVCDRHFLSAVAYQIYGRQITQKHWVWKNIPEDIREPDFDPSIRDLLDQAGRDYLDMMTALTTGIKTEYIYLDISYEMSRARLAARNEKLDNFEKETEEYHRRVHNGYSWHNYGYVVDGNDGISNIHAKIVNWLQQTFLKE